MFRLLSMLTTLAGIGYGYFWLESHHPELKKQIVDHIPTNIIGSEIKTLEVRYSCDEIKERQKRVLLKDRRYDFLNTKLKFYPFVLMDVKYLDEHEKPKEGAILWDLTDGEIVLDTNTWDKTHGFGDCIQAGAREEEFKILQAVAKNGGVCSRKSVEISMGEESDKTNRWINQCRRKHLIYEVEGNLHIHVESPHFTSVPETKLKGALVTKSYKDATKMTPHFSTTQVQKGAKAAFGQEFVVRRTRDVYLPVHAISVQNPDGSVETTHWNGVTGKKISGNLYID